MTIHLRFIRIKKAEIGNFTQLSGPLSLNSTGKTVKKAITQDKNLLDQVRGPYFI